MNIVLLIISLGFIIFLSISQFLNYKKFKHQQRLKSVYDEMEMFFYKKNIKINNDYVEVLKIFKNIAVNSDLLDIRILMLLKAMQEKKGQELENKRLWFDKTISSLPEDFKEYIKKFDLHSNKLIDLSLFKFEFLYYILKVFISEFFKTKFLTVNKKFTIDYQYVKRNEEIITYGIC